uniref:Peptidase M12A domain-containing protein n=1 Tax=Steinernema glaseri TaxID=37863 RepID=A0A1I8ANE0_9BILA
MRDSNYQQTIGQRRGLSFKDAKMINLRYCTQSCGTVGNFEKRSALTSDNMDQPYDQGSIMHYGSRAFSLDYNR